jgi:putative MATE family efflux protein
MDASRRVEALRRRVLSEPRLVRLLLWLMAPLTLSTSVHVLYEVADTFWLSILGKEALSVPVVSWPYPDILVAVAFGLAASASSLVGQYTGAGRYGEAREAAGTILSLTLAVTVPGSLAVAATASYYLDVIGVPEEVKPLALDYLVLLALGVPLAALMFIYNSSVSALGDTRTPMKIGLAATVVNAILDPILIFGLLGLPALGVLGAAIATLVARCVAAAYAVAGLATGAHGLRLRLRDLVPRRRYLRLVARISLPVVAERVALTLGFIVMASIVAGLGTVVLAAYAIGQVALAVDHVISMPLARAVSIVVAQSLGAGMVERARRAAATGAKLVVALVGAYTAILLAMAEAFVSIFAREEAVAQVATQMVWLFGPSILGFSLLILSYAVARGSGHTGLVSALGIARLWLLRIPLCYLLAYVVGMGATGLWLGMAVSNYATGAAGLAWVLRGSWARPVIEPGTAQPGAGAEHA